MSINGGPTPEPKSSSLQAFAQSTNNFFSQLSDSLSIGRKKHHLIWLLGHCYDISEPSEIFNEHEAFLQDFRSRIWVTYRRGFAPIGDSKCTSDTGWGCMLRSGQMILAQALSLHLLGREWRYDANTRQHPQYAMLLRWFIDNVNPAACPYSLHNILRYSPEQIGKWIGPHGAAVLIKKCVDAHAMDDFCMVLGVDGTVYIDSITAACTAPTLVPARPPTTSGVDAETKTGQEPITPEAKTPNCPWKAVFILVPLRLGAGAHLSADYIEGLKRCFALPSCIGVAGGRPRSSLYFVGLQGDQLIYLDPHTTQASTSLSYDLCAESSTFHCTNVHSMNIAEIDPSLSIGFYCQDKAAVELFLKGAGELTQLQCPPFYIADTAPHYDEDMVCNSLSASVVSVAASSEPENSDDDFLLI